MCKNELILAEVPGQVIVDIPTFNSKSSVNYGVLCIEGAPLKNPYLVDGQIKLETDAKVIYQDFSKGKRKVFTKLSAGVQYYFYAYASNSVSVSQLSEVKSVWVS